MQTTGAPKYIKIDIFSDIIGILTGAMATDQLRPQLRNISKGGGGRIVWLSDNDDNSAAAVLP